MDSTKVIHKLMDELFEAKKFEHDSPPYSLSILEEVYMDMRREYYGHPAVEEWFNRKHEELTGGE